MYHLLQLSQANECAGEKCSRLPFVSIIMCPSAIAESLQNHLCSYMKHLNRPACWIFSGGNPPPARPANLVPEAGRLSPHPPCAYFTIAYTFQPRVCERITL